PLRTILLCSAYAASCQAWFTRRTSDHNRLQMHSLVDDVKPSVAILAPISNLTSMGDAGDVCATLLRMIDSLKNRGVTNFCTSLTESGASLEYTAAGISSLTDACLI